MYFGIEVDSYHKMKPNLPFWAILLAILEINRVTPRAWILNKLEVLCGHSKRVEHHVPELLEVAEHLCLDFLVAGRYFGGEALQNKYIERVI